MAKLSEDQILKLVIDRFEYSKVCKATKDEEVEKYLKMYDSVVEETFPFKTKMFIPYSYMVIESIIPRVMAAIFNSRPILRARPRPENPDEINKSVDKITHLLDYAFDNDNFFDKIEMLLRTALIVGTGVIKYKWLFEIDEETYKAEELMALEEFEIAKASIKEDRPATELVSYWDYFPDPDLNQKYKIHRIITTYEDLERRNKVFKIYKNLDKIKNAGYSENIFRDVNYYNSKIGGLVRGSNIYDPHKDYIELLEYWDKDNLYVIANRSVVIRAEENPFGDIPFVEAYAVPRVDSIWGDSVLKPLERIQHYLNGLKSMKFDLLSQNLQPMWLATMDSGIEGNLLLWQPNKIVRVNNQNGLVPLRPQVTGLQDGYLEEQMLTTIMQRVSGITDYLIGIQTKNVNETATGVSLLTEASQSRVRLFIQRFGNSALRELGYRFLELYRKFTDEEVHFRIFNQSKDDMFGTIGKEELMGRYELQLVESMFYSAQLRQQQIMGLFNLLYGKPEVDNFELVKTLLDAFELKNSEDIRLTKEEYEARQIELVKQAMLKLQEQQAQQMAQGGAGGEVPSE